jgi:superfamily I DNA/RNA helicase
MSRKPDRSGWFDFANDGDDEPEPPAGKKKKKPDWSKYQMAVFADFEDDEGNTVIEAVAGSGKTTTIVEGTTKVPRGRKVILTAFNRSIRTELEKRVSRAIDVRTMHSLGKNTCERAFGDIKVDEEKGKRLAKEQCLEAGYSFRGKRDGQLVPVNWKNVAKLADRAKNTLTDEDDFGAMRDLAIDHNLDDSKDMAVEALVRLAAAAIKEAADDKLTMDFDDMVWFPARHGLRPSTHDVVCVDETQDLNAAQLYLATATCRRKGRIVAVGDRHQAIYHFRGADKDAMPRMIRELGARVLPLSISYRCPTSVAALAREIVPHFEVRSGAPKGTVATGVGDRWMREKAQPGDLILSRAKAPLVRTALSFLSRSVPSCVMGKDIGKDLVRLMEKSREPDVADMNRWVDDWAAKETKRYVKLEREDKVEEIADVRAAVFALSEGHDKTEDVVRKTLGLFRDDDPQTRVVCSTVHKAKGLERRRVWMLGDTFRVWNGEKYAEERNLYYVAVTRAIEELYIVGEVRR